MVVLQGYGRFILLVVFFSVLTMGSNFPLSRQSRLNAKKFRSILVSGYDDPGSQGWDRINKRVFQRHMESNASPYLDCQRWNPIYPTDASVDKKSGNPYPKSWAFSPKREDEDMQKLILAFQGVLEEKMKLLPEPFPMSMARI